VRDYNLGGAPYVHLEAEHGRTAQKVAEGVLVSMGYISGGMFWKGHKGYKARKKGEKDWGGGGFW